MIRESQARLKKPVARIVIIPHPERNGRRDADQRCRAVARARAGHRDRCHAETREVADACRGRASTRNGTAGKGDRRRRGVARARSGHVDAGDQAIGKHGGGRSPAATATRDRHGRRDRIRLGAAGDREAGAAQAAEGCRRRGGGATGRRCDRDHGRCRVARTFDRHRDAGDSTAAIDDRRGCGTGLGVRTAIGPVVALAVAESETAVGRRRVGTRGEVGSSRNFIVEHIATGIERGWQGGQRHWRLGLGACDRIVGQRVGEVRAHHFVGVDARPQVGRVGIGQQDKRRRSFGSVVQVIAQRIGATRHHQGVFLIGIKADLGAIVLDVEAAQLLGRP